MSEKEIKNFLIKANIFVKREIHGRPHKIKVRKVYISYYGFADECRKIKGIELISRNELEKWARRLGVPPISDIQRFIKKSIEATNI